MAVHLKFLRLPIIAATCVASVLLCCGLAWWQWERFSSVEGSFQNLGYVLQWPLFGLFPAFVFWRMRKLRRASAAHVDVDRREVLPADTLIADEAVVPTPHPGLNPAGKAHRANDDVYADDDDEALASYNRYLAELHQRGQSGR